MSEASFNPDFPSVFRSSFADPAIPAPPPAPVKSNRAELPEFVASGSKPASVAYDQIPGSQLGSKAPSVVGDEQIGSKAPSVAQQSPQPEPVPSQAAQPQPPSPQPSISKAPAATLPVRSPSVSPSQPQMMVPPNLSAPMGPRQMMVPPNPSAPMVPSPLGMMEASTAALIGANFELQSELEKAKAKIRLLEREQKEFVDRLEKAVAISARLKDIEVQHNDLKDKYVESENFLKVSRNRILELEQALGIKSELLTQVRQKYANERERSEKQLVELETVRTAAELAKQEVENQTQRASLREMQLSTTRNLLESGMVTTPQSTVNNPLRSMGDDELRLASSGWLKQSSLESVPMPQTGGIKMTSWKDWQVTQSVDHVPCAEDVRRLMLSGGLAFSGTLLDDKTVRVSVSAQIDLDTARVYITVTNASSSIIQSVRILNATRTNSFFDFVVESKSEPFLKPGQHISAHAEMSLVSLFDSQVACPIFCVSYSPSGDVPKNCYLQLPLHVVKFLRPVVPDTESLLNKWMECEQNEVCVKFNVRRDDLKSFSQIANVGGCGGSLMAQRAIDPNPRGQIFAGALPAGKHGAVKEVIVRVELTPPDHRGPMMMRITVRSPALLLSKSVATSLMDVLF